MSNDRSPDAELYADIGPMPLRAAKRSNSKKLKRSAPRRSLKLPFNLLPLGSLERNIYAGIAAIAAWYVMNNWFLGGYYSFGYYYGDNLATYSTQVVYFGIYDFIGTAQANSLSALVISALSLLFVEALPTALGIGIAATAVLLILNALGVIALKARLVVIAPIILTSVLGVIVYSIAFVPPVTALIDGLFPSVRQAAFRFDFPWGSWINEIVSVLGQLVVPIAVAILAWVPAIAPEKE